MQVESGASAILASNAVGTAAQRRTLLRLRVGSAYRIFGFQLHMLFLPAAFSDVSGLTMLKAAPVAIDFDASRITLMGTDSLAAMGHPAVIGFTAMNAAASLPTGPSPVVVAFEKPLEVPGLYVDAMVAGPVAAVTEGLALWTVRYETKQMSPLALAALATGWGWDPDMTEPPVSAFLETRAGSGGQPIG